MDMEKQGKKMIQKNCALCGSPFEAKTDRAQYCDKCRKDTSKEIRRQSRAIIESKKRCGDYDPPREKTCRYCGKTYIGTRKTRPYCSNTCQEKYTVENRTCTYCGKPLYPEIIVKNPGGIALHPKCREPYLEKRARERGMYHICPVCGNEYRANKSAQIYCGSACRQTAIKHPETYGNDCECIVCKKTFKLPITVSQNKTPTENQTCSQECRDKYLRYVERKRLEREKASKEHSEHVKMMAASRQRAKREQENLQNGLCGYCKTSYKDCPWMSSKFRTRPEGAMYNNGKITKCPLFKDSRPRLK